MNYLTLFISIFSFIFLLILFLYSGANEEEFTSILVNKFGRIKGSLIFIFYMCAVFSALITLAVYFFSFLSTDTVGYLPLIATFV